MSLKLILEGTITQGLNVLIKQEYIPVGCVPPASVAISGVGYLPRGVSTQGVFAPPANRMTDRQV